VSEIIISKPERRQINRLADCGRQVRQPVVIESEFPKFGRSSGRAADQAGASVS
jgi:hypothetical protein